MGYLVQLWRIRSHSTFVIAVVFDVDLRYLPNNCHVNRGYSMIFLRYFLPSKRLSCNDTLLSCHVTNSKCSFSIGSVACLSEIRCIVSTWIIGDIEKNNVQRNYILVFTNSGLTITVCPFYYFV